MDVVRLPMLALSKSASPFEFVLGFPASDFLVPLPKAVRVVAEVMISRACFDDGISLHDGDMQCPATSIIYRS